MGNAARKWVGSVASFVTVFALVGSLSMSWRILHAGSSADVAFFPLAAAIISLLAWLLYGVSTGDRFVIYVNGFGLALMQINCYVHCIYSEDIVPGLALIAGLTVMQSALLFMTSAWLGKLAFVCTLACNVAPIDRIRTVQLPEVAACTLSACGLWTAYGVLAKDVPLWLSNLVGAGVAAVELAVAAWTWLGRDVDLLAKAV